MTILTITEIMDRYHLGINLAQQRMSEIKSLFPNGGICHKGQCTLQEAELWEEMQEFKERQHIEELKEKWSHAHSRTNR